MWNSLFYLIIINMFFLGAAGLFKASLRSGAAERLALRALFYPCPGLVASVLPNCRARGWKGGRRPVPQAPKPCNTRPLLACRRQASKGCALI